MQKRCHGDGATALHGVSGAGRHVSNDSGFRLCSGTTHGDGERGIAVELVRVLYSPASGR